MAANRFDQLIDEWDPRLRKAFLDGVYRLRDRAQVEAIARALERGDVEGAIRAVGLDPLEFRPFERALLDAFEAAAIFTALTVPPIRDGGTRRIFRFDIRNVEADQFLRRHTADLIDRIFADQENMLREQFTADRSAGVPPLKSARKVAGTRKAQTGRREGGLIGLTATQAEWARNYDQEIGADDPGLLRKSLDRVSRDKRFDRAVKEALEKGEPLPAALRDKMNAAYANRLLRYRSTRLSELETRTMLHEAQRQALKQAIDSGILVPSQLVFKWRSMRDHRVRRGPHASHVYLDGKSTRWGQPFIGIAGAVIRYPGDPEAPPEEIIGCRCWLESIINLYAPDR